MLPYRPMNVSNTLYRTLVQTDLALLEQITQAVQNIPLEGAQTVLAPHFLSTTIDYERLYRLLRKDFRDCDLRGEDFQWMPLADFHFEGANLSQAKLDHADLVHAHLQRASLSEASLCSADLSGANLYDTTLTDSDFRHAILKNASCQRAVATHIRLNFAQLDSSIWDYALLTGGCLIGVNAPEAQFVNTNLSHATLTSAHLERCKFSALCKFSDLSGTDFRGANLQGADLFACDLTHARLEGADLRNCLCQNVTFGGSWCIDEQTLIDPNDHTLIGMTLLHAAKSPAQQQFALYVQYQKRLCWSGFICLLVKNNPELISWAKDVLSGIESFRITVDAYLHRLESFRQEVSLQLDVSRVSQPLRDLLLTEMAQHAELSHVALSWYLQGVLFAASKQPEMQIDEATKLLILVQLQQLRGSEPEEDD